VEETANRFDNNAPSTRDTCTIRRWVEDNSPSGLNPPISTYHPYPKGGTSLPKEYWSTGGPGTLVLLIERVVDLEISVSIKLWLGNQPTEREVATEPSSEHSELSLPPAPNRAAATSHCHHMEALGGKNRVLRSGWRGYIGPNQSAYWTQEIGWNQLSEKPTPLNGSTH